MNTGSQANKLSVGNKNNFDNFIKSQPKSGVILDFRKVKVIQTAKKVAPFFADYICTELKPKTVLQSKTVCSELKSRKVKTKGNIPKHWTYIFFRNKRAWNILLNVSSGNKNRSSDHQLSR